MIHLVVTMRIQPGSRQAFLELFNGIRPSVLAEAGCVQYQLCGDLPGGTDAPDPNGFILIEQWESEAHLKAHLATEHMKTFSRAVTPLRVSTAVRILKPLA
jgi:quinol monooxygenase YgiN